MAQDPNFDRFKKLFQSGQFEHALSVLDELILDHPESAALHWHRVNCLEKLHRFGQVPLELERLLEKKPDFVPALIKRVEYSEWFLEAIAPLPEELDEIDQDQLSPRQRESHARALQARAVAEADLRQIHERDLRWIIEHDHNHPHAHYLLSELMAERARLRSEPSALQESNALLDRAIERAPEQVDYRLTRAERLRASALVEMEWSQDQASPLRPEHVETFSGMRFDRAKLTLAAKDFAACFEQSRDFRHAVKLGNVLHDLGQFDAALNCYDQALAALPRDDARRQMIEDMRYRSSNQGAGEREQMAQTLLSGLDDGDGSDQNLHDHLGALTIRGIADSVRRGKPLQAALDSHISDDPDTQLAMSLARQILNVAQEPPPWLEGADPARFPKFQRKHCDAVEREALALGLNKIGDAEARGLFAILGQHVLLRVFGNDEGDIGMASFAIKPKWPGLLGFLILFFTGKWKVQTMVECVTQFADGTHISTQPESISPFEYGGKIKLQKLPKSSTVAEIYHYHANAVAAYRATHPSASPMRIHDLKGVEARWIAGQQSKLAYRESIGYVTDKELRALLGNHYERLAEKIKAQIRNMV